MSTVAVHEWPGEAADISPALTTLRASGAYVVDGTRFEVPTREDYRTALATAGLPATGTLEDDPYLAAAIQAHWHAGGYNACVFAVNLSATRAASGWETYVLAGGHPRERAEHIAAICSERLPVPEVQVVSALLPRTDAAADVRGLVRHLGSLSDWRLDELGHVDSPQGPAELLGLRAKVELDHWAEVLGFGRFAGQANTRLAPFTELAIRAKEPRRPRRSRRAYMADIEMGIDNVEMREWWHDTEHARAARLGQEGEPRAKARVTFALTDTCVQRGAITAREVRS